MSASAVFAQSQWKEIPVGYNMPKSVMAAAPPSTPFPNAPKNTSRYSGEGRNPSFPWEIEFHGGGFWNIGGVSGQGFTAPAAATFNGLAGGVGPQSLQVSSYFFGPGAALYNQFTQGPAALTNTITPLDPLLDNQFGRRHGGPAIGVRFGRDLNPWFGIEFSADWNTSPIAIDDKQLLGIEQTRASLANSFTEFTTSVAPGTALAISSIKRSAGSQLFWTGVVNVNLKPEGKTIPYLTFGGGAVSNIGPAPHASLLGFYAFDSGSGPHAETDLVNIQARPPRTQWVAVLGIGAKYYATSRWGLRFDFRDHVTSNSTDTVLFATPNVATLSPADAVAYIGPGAPVNLIFSNDPSKGPSSLSGPAITKGIRTFKGSGITNQLNGSAGVFYRF
jgi:hypothetical protein